MPLLEPGWLEMIEMGGVFWCDSHQWRVVLLAQ
jgi:hypothetical protein